MFAGRSVLYWIVTIILAVLVFFVFQWLIPLLAGLVGLAIPVMIVNILALLIALAVVWGGYGYNRGGPVP